MERKGEELNIMDITERILARKWDNPQFYFPTYADDHVSTWILYPGYNKNGIMLWNI